MARFLFVAPASESWGEFLSGRRIAIELAARGHQITFLIPKSLTPQLAGVPCRIGQLDGAMGKLDHAILSAVQQTHSDALVLVDAAGVVRSITHGDLNTTEDAVAALFAPPPLPSQGL